MGRNIMELDEKLLFKVWEFALNQIQTTQRLPHESNGIYMSKAWVTGMLQALNSGGYSVCISKDGKEVWSSKQS